MVTISSGIPSWKKGLHLAEHVAPVGFHLLGMKADHRIEVAGILLTQGRNGERRRQVDGRHKHLFYACLAGTLDDGRKVVTKCFVVEMRMSIDHWCDALGASRS